MQQNPILNKIRFRKNAKDLFLKEILTFQHDNLKVFD